MWLTGDNVYLGIMLARIKLSMPEIRRSLLEIDDQALSVDDLKAISKQLPTLDEVGLIFFPTWHMIAHHCCLDWKTERFFQCWQAS